MVDGSYFHTQHTLRHRRPRLLSADAASGAFFVETGLMAEMALSPSSLRNCEVLAEQAQGWSKAVCRIVDAVAKCPAKSGSCIMKCLWALRSLPTTYPPLLMDASSRLQSPERCTPKTDSRIFLKATASPSLKVGMSASPSIFLSHHLPMNLSDT